MRSVAALLASAILTVSAAFAEDVKVGFLGPLSGNAAILGSDALIAAQIAVDDVNLSGGIQGRPLKLLVEDDQMLAKQTVTGFRKLTEQEGVRVVLVYGYSGLFSIAELAQKAGVLLIDPLDCDEDIAKLPENVICIAKLTEYFGHQLADDMVARDALPAGVLYYTSDAFPVKVTEALKNRLRTHGKELASETSYHAEERDFRTYLMGARARKLKSLAIFGELEVGIILKQARELNFPGQLYSFSTILGPDVRKIAGDAINGVRIVDWTAEESPAYAEFLSKFKLRTGRDPALQISTVPTYDVINLIAAALRASTPPGIDTPAATVKKYLYRLKDYQGASGKITIDSDGCVRSLRTHLADVKNGERVR